MTVEANMRKFCYAAILLLCGLWLYNRFEAGEEAETAYSQEELDKVSAFLMYERQHTETFYQYCLVQNYKLDNLLNEFKHRHQRQKQEAETFIKRFHPAERLAFYQELKRTYAAMEPEIMNHLEQSYNKNRNIHTSAGVSFTRTDFCRWMDSHPEILFAGKTDEEALKN